MEYSDVSHVLGLHGLAYDLLMWLDARAISHPQLLSPERVEVMKRGSACADWLRADRHALPSQLLPEDSDIPAFAHLLSSFFHTSFHVQYFKFNDALSEARLKAGVDEGSRQRKGGRHPEMTSKQILALALKHLASAEGIKLDEPEAKKVSQHASVERDLVIWAYVWELGRRAKRTSKGPALHSLWKKIALDDRKNLSADLVWSARAKILAYLNDRAK